MDKQNRQQRDLERLERKRQAINERMQKQMERVNERFDKKQAQLNGKLNVKQEMIISAALELLSEQGLNSLSLRDIAKRLDIQAPALYWYFKNKEDLIDYMAEAILQKEFHDLQPRQEGETWQDWLTNHMLQLRRAMLAFPDGARVVAGAHLGPAVTLARSFEYSLVSLSSAGVDMQTARHITMTATNYTFGYVIEEQASPTPEQIAHIDMERIFNLFPNLIATVRDAHNNKAHEDEDYTIGLQYIIKGATV